MEEKLHLARVAGPDGRIQEILIEGDSESDAMRRLQARGLTVVQFLGVRDARNRSAGKVRGFRRKFDAADFTDRLVPLLEADIPLEKALGIVEETAESSEERELISGLRRGLHEGRPLSQLIAGKRRHFPRMYASIVEAGEEAGALPQVLAQLREFLNMTREMKNFLMSASVYPMFVIIVCFGVIATLLLFVVPKLAKVLVGNNDAPSMGMAILLGASQLLQNYWWVAIIVLIGLLLFVREVMTKEGAAREWWDETVLKLPLLGHIVILANIGRQVRTMSILMKSGVHLLDTVSISARVLQNVRIRESISGLAGGLRRGERLSSALARSEYMPKLVTRMLAVGEETGNTAGMLARVADRYDDELRQTIKKALAWFEPLIIIVLGLVVGSIVLTLFMAIMDMQNNL